MRGNDLLAKGALLGFSGPGCHSRSSPERHPDHRCRPCIFVHPKTSLPLW